MTARPLDAAQDALIALQGQLIALLAAQNAALAARVGELEAANAELSARMDRLERAASRNSGNSSLARDQGLAAVPDDAKAADLRLFRRDALTGNPWMPPIPAST